VIVVDEDILYGSSKRPSIEQVQLDCARSRRRSFDRRTRSEAMVRYDQLWLATKIMLVVLTFLALLSAVTPNL
jgi:hypothetical protein